MTDPALNHTINVDGTGLKLLDPGTGEFLRRQAGDGRSEFQWLSPADRHDEGVVGRLQAEKFFPQVKLLDLSLFFPAEGNAFPGEEPGRQGGQVEGCRLRARIATCLPSSTAFIAARMATSVLP